MPSRFVASLIAVSVCLHFVGPVAADSKTMTVQEFVQVQDEWGKFAREKTELTLTGRFAGRFARKFRLAKIPFLVIPLRSTTLPADVDPGERITVSGLLKQSGTRFTFDAARIAIGATDYDRFRRDQRDLKPDRYSDAYQLAKKYESIALFYEDEFLQKQINAFQRQTFLRQRAAASTDPQQLTKLLETAQKLGLSEELQMEVRFQALVLLSRNKSADSTKLVQRIREELPGWDKEQKAIDPKRQAAFRKTAVDAYAGLPTEERPEFHRLLYRSLRLPQLKSLVNADSSNADDIARQIEKELPEEHAVAKELNGAYAAFRLSEVPTLTRSQLKDFQELLAKLNRPDDFPIALDQWLKAQEKRLNNQQLDGLLDTADQYLFAFERWKTPKHKRAGTDLLKKGWQLAAGAAPAEAATIERRLEQLGWVRLREAWLTVEAVEALPENDMDLAMKEGRVVAGMKVAQVEAILGKPGRRVRVATRSKVQQIWIYGGEESSGVTVHLTRRTLEPESESVVTQVARSRR